MGDIVLAGYKWTRQEWAALDPEVRKELIACARRKRPRTHERFATEDAAREQSVAARAS